jgi:hypothetical protein
VRDEAQDDRNEGQEVVGAAGGERGGSGHGATLPAMSDTGPPAADAL